jgi:hypothetical protein
LFVSERECLAKKIGFVLQKRVFKHGPVLRSNAVEGGWTSAFAKLRRGKQRHRALDRMDKMKVNWLSGFSEAASVVPGGTLGCLGPRPSHKSRARVAGYFQMSQRDMTARPWPLIEKQSCGDFSGSGEKDIVRHYPYFATMMEDGKWTVEELSAQI